MAEEEEEDKRQPIIIIKKKVSHGGHHGGAWKVAYADFVTAMMALFIVLWLLNTSEEVQEAISSYFNDPSGTGQQMGSSAVGSGSGIEVAQDDMDKLKDLLDQALKEAPNFDQLKDHVEMSVTGEGLRIELLESETGMFFQSGSALPSAEGAELIATLAEQLGQMPNDIVIEGHTDSKPFGANDNYSNWELSVDRANSSRRLMESRGLTLGQVVQVRGFADHDLRQPEDPEAATNRRISVIVRYRNPPPGWATESADEEQAGHGEPLSLETGGEGVAGAPTPEEVPVEQEESEGEHH